VNTLLKAASKRGVRVRQVAVARKEDLWTENLPDSIEYRTFMSRTKKENSGSRTEDVKLLNALGMAIKGFYCLVVIDDVESFVIIQNSRDESRSTGLSAKIPEVSILQRIMFEKLIAQRTSKYTAR